MKIIANEDLSPTSWADPEPFLAAGQTAEFRYATSRMIVVTRSDGVQAVFPVFRLAECGVTV
jgi:hypothetical protein